MSRSGRNYGKKPPDIGLQMECHDDALTPEQAAAYNKGEKEYKEVTAKLEQMMKNLGGEIVEKTDNVYVMQMNSSPPAPVPALTPTTPTTGKSVTSPVTRQSSALIAQPPPATNAMVQALQTATGPVILQQPPAVVQPPAGTYQLMMDPRLGLIVGTVTSSQPTPGTPVIQDTTSLAKTPSVSSAPSIQTRSTVHTRTSSARMQTPTTPTQAPTKLNLVSTTPPTPNPTPTVPSLRIKPPKPTSNQKATNLKPAPMPPSVSASASASSKASGSNARPTESNSVGGLSAGQTNKPWRPTTTGTVNAPVVDLTDDDGKPSSTNVADSREVTFNKLSGKTFPSLVVVARPHLRIKDMAQGTVSQERAALGRRGARGKGGHKEAKASERRKKNAVEREGPRPLRLRLEQVNSATHSADRRTTRSQKRAELEHPRYVVEVVGLEESRHAKKQQAGGEAKTKTKRRKLK